MHKVSLPILLIEHLRGRYFIPEGEPEEIIDYAYKELQNSIILDHVAFWYSLFYAPPEAFKIWQKLDLLKATRAIDTIYGTAVKHKPELFYDDIPQEELDEIKRILREKTVIVIGMGGITSNILKAFTHMGIKFKRLVLFEPDKIDLTNIYRMPIKSLLQIPRYKADLIYEMSEIANNLEVHKTYLPIDKEYIESFDIVFGAPTIETRIKLAEAEIGFNNTYFTLHLHDNFLLLRPQDYVDFDETLVVETYGQIHLEKFACGVVEYAKRFARHLAGINTDMNVSGEEAFTEYNIAIMKRLGYKSINEYKENWEKPLTEKGVNAAFEYMDKVTSLLEEA